MGKKGFTLIEIITVIIIIGIILTIAVPAVSSYILKSRKTNYSGTISAYVETIKGEYDMGEFGDYIDDSELMIVPIKIIKLEKGESDSSPFGKYDFDKSYVLIKSNTYTNDYYVTFVDSADYGVSNVKIDNVSSETIDKVNSREITDITSYFSCNGKEYEFNNNIFTYDGKNYIACDYRIYKDEIVHVIIAYRFL